MSNWVLSHKWCVIYKVNLKTFIEMSFFIKKNGYNLKKIHERICGIRIKARTLAAKTMQVDFY
jgi:hypothetical protein